jgi:hypothetical protein
MKVVTDVIQRFRREARVRHRFFHRTSWRLLRLYLWFLTEGGAATPPPPHTPRTARRACVIVCRALALWRFRGLIYLIACAPHEATATLGSQYVASQGRLSAHHASRGKDPNLLTPASPFLPSLPSLVTHHPTPVNPRHVRTP